MGNELQKCKDIVKRMKLATDRQRNISMEVKNGLAELEESLDIISSLQKRMCKDPQALQIDGSSQTTPQSTSSSTRQKERPEVRDGTPTINPEAKKRPPSSPLTKEAEKRKKKETPKDGNAVPRLSTPSRRTPINPVKQKAPELKGKIAEKEGNVDPAKQPALKKKDGTGSGTAPNHIKQKKKRQPKPKPTAILIKPRGTETYAEILREIRSKANPDDTETKIKTVRQTRSGDVLVEFAEKSKGKECFSSSLKAILGDKANIQHLEPKMTLEIKDMDELTTEEEVETAIKAAINEPAADLQITLFKANRRAQRMALAQLNVRSANELLKASRIKIGWVHCRVRQRAVVTRCFKCFGFGHMQATCKGPNRRSQGLCFNCGEQGHQKTECKKSAKCCLCTELSLKPELLAHIPGSGACRVFREALEKEKKNIVQ